jgi:tRNA(fMet)-specific endonuclease VapC
MLDSSVAVPLRDGDAVIVERVDALGESVVISALTRSELEDGVYREPAFATIRRALLDRVLLAIPVIPFDDAAATAYGRILSATGYSRRKVIDRMIAATAIVHDAALVTTNAADLADVPGLKLEAWG